MKSRFETTGVALAVALWGALAAGPAGPAVAEQASGSGSEAAGHGGGRHDGPGPSGGSGAGSGGGAGSGAAVAPDAMTGGSKTGGSKSGAAPTGGPEHGIDLTRPDDGYGSLHGQTVHKSPILTTPGKPGGPPTIVGIQPQAPRIIRPLGVDVTRNPVGVAVPGAAGIDVHHHTAPGFMLRASIPSGGPSTVGIVRSGVAGVEIKRPPFQVGTAPGPSLHPGGINGSSFGHSAVGPASVGGPVKDRSGVNGTPARVRN